MEALRNTLPSPQLPSEVPAGELGAEEGVWHDRGGQNPLLLHENIINLSVPQSPHRIRAKPHFGLPAVKTSLRGTK